jgi:hypothetical protein
LFAGRAIAYLSDFRSVCFLCGANYPADSHRGRDPDFIKLNVEYAMDVIIAGQLINMLPYASVLFFCQKLADIFIKAHS